MIVFERIKTITGGATEDEKKLYDLFIPEYNKNYELWIDKNTGISNTKDYSILFNNKKTEEFSAATPNTLKEPILRYLKGVYDLIPMPNLSPNININTNDLNNLKNFMNNQYYPVINYLKTNYGWNGGLPTELATEFGFNAFNNGIIVAKRYINLIENINNTYKSQNNGNDIRDILHTELWIKEQNGSYKFRLPTELDLDTINKHKADVLNQPTGKESKYYRLFHFKYQNIYGYFISDHYYYTLYYMNFMYDDDERLKYLLNEVFYFVDRYREIVLYKYLYPDNLNVNKQYNYFYNNTDTLNTFTTLVKQYNDELKKFPNSKLKQISLNLINEVLF